MYYLTSGFFSFSEKFDKVFFKNWLLTIGSNLIFLYSLIYSLNSSLEFDPILKNYYGNFKIKCSTSLTNELHRPIFFRFPSSYCITNSRKLLFFDVKKTFSGFIIFKQIA